MSALTLERLVFDPTDVAEGPSVGSYIISSGGDVIDSTDVGGTEGLNVNVLNDIDVGLDQTEDSVAIGDGATLFDTAVQDVAAAAGHAGFSSMAVHDAALSALTSAEGDFEHMRVNADGALWVEFVNSDIAITGDVSVTQGTDPWVVSATDLDIRDLSASTDSIAIGDGTDSLDVNADGSINVVIAGQVADDAADAGDPLKIGGRAHDTSAALGSLDDGDRFDLLGDDYRRVFVNDAPNVAGASNAVSVDTTAGGTALGSGLAGRTRMLIQNNGDKSIFVGFGTVTAANGIEVSKKSTLALECGEALAPKAIAASGTQDVRVFEMA